LYRLGGYHGDSRTQTIADSTAKAKHLRATDKLMRLLATYVETSHLGEVFMEKALLCLTRNDYEPDLCFFGREKADVSLSPQAIRGRNRIVRRCRLSDPGTSCFRPCDPSRNATASSRVKRL